MKTMIRKKICFLAVAACVAVGAGLALNNDAVSASAAAEGITMDNGASIRINSADYTGDIRFTATVSDDTLLTAEDKSCGIIVAKDDGTLMADNFVFNAGASDLVSETEWMCIDSKDTGFSYNEGKKQFSLVVTDVPMANYNDNFAARAYVRNGSTYTYTDFTSRAISFVAQEAIQAKDSDLNDSTSETYEYRPKVLNMMGDTLVTGTTVAGDLQLVDETTTIDIGAVEDTYSFAYNAGEYDLKLVREKAWDYQYELSLTAGETVNKNLQALDFKMKSNIGETTADVHMYEGAANDFVDSFTVSEEGNKLIVDTSVLGVNYTWFALSLKLPDTNKLKDDTLYYLSYKIKINDLSGGTSAYFTAGSTAKPTASYKATCKETTWTEGGTYSFNGMFATGIAGTTENYLDNRIHLYSNSDTNNSLSSFKIEITDLMLEEAEVSAQTGGTDLGNFYALIGWGYASVTPGGTFKFAHNAPVFLPENRYDTAYWPDEPIAVKTPTLTYKWASSDTSIIKFTDETTGQASFLAAGKTRISVSVTLPGGSEYVLCARDVTVKEATT